MESNLTGYMSTWYSSCISRKHKALQREVIGAPANTGSSLPALEDIYMQRSVQKGHRIIKDPSHPCHGLFTFHKAGSWYHGFPNQKTSNPMPWGCETSWGIRLHGPTPSSPPRSLHLALHNSTPHASHCNWHCHCRTLSLLVACCCLLLLFIHYSLLFFPLFSLSNSVCDVANASEAKDFFSVPVGSSQGTWQWKPVNPLNAHNIKAKVNLHHNRLCNR